MNGENSFSGTVCRVPPGDSNEVSEPPENPGFAPPGKHSRPRFHAHCPWLAGRTGRLGMTRPSPLGAPSGPLEVLGGPWRSLEVLEPLTRPLEVPTRSHRSHQVPGGPARSLDPWWSLDPGSPYPFRFDGEDLNVGGMRFDAYCASKVRKLNNFRSCRPAPDIGSRRLASGGRFRC
jgi:hypothetical protein